MGGKLIIMIRFNLEGREAELYRKIQQGKRSAGLSTPEYVKSVLLGYFEDLERQKEEQTVLWEIREECCMMAERLGNAVRQGLQEHEAVMIRAIGGNDLSLQEKLSGESQAGTRLPEISEKIPEGALSFLDKY